MAVIVAASLALRLAVLVSTAGDPVFDIPMLDAEYAVDWAHRIQAEGLWVSPENTAYFRTPLYAWMLAGLFALPGPDLPVALAFQALLGAIAAGWLAGIAGRRFGPRAFWATGLLAGVSWPLLYFGRELLIAPVAFFLGTALLRALDRTDETSSPGRWFALGLLVGLGAVARANSLVLGVALLVLAIFAYGRRRPALRSLALLAGIAVCVAPITLRNRIVSGEWVLLSSQGGINLWIGNHPHADGMSTEVPGLSFWRNEDVSAALALQYGRPLGPSEQDAHYRRLAIDYFRTQPAEALRSLLRKTYLFVQGYEIRNNRDLYVTRARDPILALPLPDFGWILPLAFVGIVAAPRRRRLVPLLAYAAAVALSVILFFVCSRYRLPAWPAFLVLAGGGVSALIEPGATLRRRATLLGLLVIAVVLTRIDFLAIRHPDPSQSHHQIGNSYARAGRDAEAEREFREALRLAPGFAEAHHHLGALLLRQGRVGEAIPELRAAASGLPRSFRARRSLAEALEAAGDVSGALAVRREAAELSAGSLPDRLALATTLGMHGDYAESLTLFREIEGGGHALDGYFFLNAGQTALAVRDEALGLQWLARARDDAATRAAATSAIARYYLANDRPDEALRELDMAIAPGTAPTDLLRLRALARYRRGDVAGAARDLEAVLAADPTDQESRARLDQLRAGGTPAP